MLFRVFKKVVSKENNERKGCETLAKYVECSGSSDIARTGEQFSWQFGLAVRQRRPVDWTNLSCLARLPSNPLYTPFIPFTTYLATPVRLCLSSSYLALLPSVFIIPFSLANDATSFRSVRVISRKSAYPYTFSRSNGHVHHARSSSFKTTWSLTLLPVRIKH